MIAPLLRLDKYNDRPTSDVQTPESDHVALQKQLAEPNLRQRSVACDSDGALRRFVNRAITILWGVAYLVVVGIKIGAKVVSHGRYVTFQMAEVAIPCDVFAELLQRIAALRSPPALALR